MKRFNTHGGQGKKRKLPKLRRHRSTPTIAEDAGEQSVGSGFRDIEPHNTNQADEGQDHEAQDQHGQEEEDDDNDEDEDAADDEDENEEDGDKQRLAKFLVNVAAFPGHMESREGGAKTAEYAKLAAKRMWTLLDGTHFRSRQTRLEPSAGAVYAWTLSLIETEFAHISKFLDELALRKGLKANTIKTYLTSSYIPFFIWHRYDA